MSRGTGGGQRRRGRCHGYKGGDGGRRGRCHRPSSASSTPQGTGWDSQHPNQTSFRENGPANSTSPRAADSDVRVTLTKA